MEGLANSYVYLTDKRVYAQVMEQIDDKVYRCLIKNKDSKIADEEAMLQLVPQNKKCEAGGSE